jgi:hypothetical protein
MTIAKGRKNIAVKISQKLTTTAKIIGIQAITKTMTINKTNLIAFQKSTKNSTTFFFT